MQRIAAAPSVHVHGRDAAFRHSAGKAVVEDARDEFFVAGRPLAPEEKGGADVPLGETVEHDRRPRGVRAVIEGDGNVFGLFFSRRAAGGKRTERSGGEQQAKQFLKHGSLRIKLRSARRFRLPTGWWLQYSRIGFIRT